jgi:mono/diheme cytochrome c family protein
LEVSIIYFIFNEPRELLKTLQATNRAYLTSKSYIMKYLIIICIVLSIIWSLNSCDSAKSNSQTTTDNTANTPLSKDSLVKRGNYLVSIIGCNDCHSPKHMGPHGPEIDSLNMLSGFPSSRPVPVAGANDIQNGLIVFNGDLTAAIGPWGTSFAANITSDETGIGTWTEEQFKNALRHGKSKGMDNGRMIMPPMPWQNFSHLTDADIQAIFYYLKSTKPFRNVVPAFKPNIKS